MSSENMGPPSDPKQGHPRSFPLKKHSIVPNGDEDTQPRLQAVSPTNAPSSNSPSPMKGDQPEPAYREHVTGTLFVPPSEAPNFRPAYQPYQQPPATQRQPTPGQPYPYQPAAQTYPQQYPPAYPSYPGYPPYGMYNVYTYPYPYSPYGAYPGYYGYPGYWYPYGWWQPPKPKRDGYQLTISIVAFIGAILACLAGLLNILIFALVAVLPNMSTMGADVRFGGMMEYLAFAISGLVGGTFALYHSIRALFLRKSSAEFKLPWFWLFLALYLVVVAVGTALYFTRNAVTNIPLTMLLILMAGILPAATFLSLGLRRVHFPREARWPTTWRRFALAVASGATLAILLASILEVILTLVAAVQLGITNLSSIDNPELPANHNTNQVIFLFIIVSLIAPVVEEAVKPLAVVALIGRIRSAAEAFVLGMACGIGFDLIETTGYIGLSYKSWLETALERSTAGLLHGFGAGMVALGWYFMTHPKSTTKVNHILLAFGCWIYALLQHAIWNGSFGLQLLPAPIGPYLDKGTIQIGPISFQSFLLVYLFLSILMFIFFLWVTKKLRSKQAESPPDGGRERQPFAGQPPQAAWVGART